MQSIVSLRPSHELKSNRKAHIVQKNLVLFICIKRKREKEREILEMVSNPNTIYLSRTLIMFVAFHSLHFSFKSDIKYKHQMHDEWLFYHSFLNIFHFLWRWQRWRRRKLHFVYKSGYTHENIYWDVALKRDIGKI